MGDLLGLPGVKRERVPASGAGSVSGAMKVVREGRYFCGAGDTGSIVAYRDDDGAYRAIFQRRFATLGECVAKTLSELRAWLVEWWPQMDCEVRYVSRAARPAGTSDGMTRDARAERNRDGKKD